MQPMLKEHTRTHAYTRASVSDESQRVNADCSSPQREREREREGERTKQQLLFPPQVHKQQPLHNRMNVSSCAMRGKEGEPR